MPIFELQYQKTINVLRTLLTSSLLIFTSMMLAQISITDLDYFPEQGDSLITALDESPSGINVGPAGANQSWDFSTLNPEFINGQAFQAASTGVNFTEFPSTELRTSVGEAAEGYYNVNDETFSLVGYAGNDPIGLGIDLVARFDPSVVERWASLEFGDNRSPNAELKISFSADDLPQEILDQIPVDLDSLRISIENDRTDVVDAWGTMDLPVGSYDVLREKRTLFSDVRIEAKVSILPWFDITDIILEFLPFDGIGQDTTVTYVYWSNQAKEAIATVVVTSVDDDTPLTVNYKYEPPSSNIGQNGPKPSLKVFPNPAISLANFRFEDLPTDFYRLEIFNVLGQPIWSESYYLSGDHNTTVDVSEFSRGIYLYRLSNGQGEVLLTRRLLLVGP